MHPLHLALTVLDIAHDRTLEAERRARLFANTEAAPVDRPSSGRRALARLAADVSRRSADAARWLDAGTADPVTPGQTPRRRVTH